MKKLILMVGLIGTTPANADLEFLNLAKDWEQIQRISGMPMNKLALSCGMRMGEFDEYPDMVYNPTKMIPVQVTHEDRPPTIAMILPLFVKGVEHSYSCIASGGKIVDTKLVKVPK